MNMRALTLWQPWASLMADRVKWIETRSWKAPRDAIGDRIAIHAAARRPHQHPVGDYIAFDSLLDGHWVASHYASGCEGAPADIPLPLGVIVASGVLTACIPMVDGLSCPDGVPHIAVQPSDLWLCAGNDGPPPPREVTDQRPYGDFTPGRWAWLFNDVLPTQRRCPLCDDGYYPHIIDEPQARDAGISRLGPPCHVCNALGKCDPVPVRGGQRVWWWRP